MDTYPETIIISGATPTFDATELLLADLKADKYATKLVQGRYEGVDEQSIVVTIPAGKTFTHVKRQFIKYMEDYRQYSLLLLSPQREAYLVDVDGVEIHIGRWQPASKRVAAERDACTYDPETDQYFIIQ